MALAIAILAAGNGSRMTANSTPKVLRKLAGKPLLQHVIDTTATLDAKYLYLVHGNNKDLLQNQLAMPAATTIRWVHQTEQLGTGHAVQQVMSHVPDNVTRLLVLYGDVPLINTSALQNLIQHTSVNQLGLLTARVRDPVGMGRIVRGEHDQTIQAIIEEKDATAQQRAICEINTGIYLLPVCYLHPWLTQLTNDNKQREYYLTDLVRFAAGDGVTIVDYPVQHDILARGINTNLQLLKAERDYQQFLAQQLLDQGVTLFDLTRIDIRGNLTVGTNVTIDINCIFDGNVQVGDNCNIGSNCVLKNVTIANNVTIKPHSMLEDVKVGNDCIIGPFARLRPGTVLQDAVHIGNFVETKNAKFAKASKANHLSYIGDATIGQHVNIGAGTITCNYDGANKHHTTIADHAFIGSNTALVAPVNIGHNATIGAGSTITKDVPDNNLAIARSKQLIIDNWQRPKPDSETTSDG